MRLAYWTYCWQDLLLSICMWFTSPLLPLPRFLWLYFNSILGLFHELFINFPLNIIDNHLALFDFLFHIIS